MNRTSEKYSFQINEIKGYIENRLNVISHAKYFKKKYKSKYLLIQRAFKREMNVSVSVYALKYKMEKSKDLLASMSCEDVAKAMGFSSAYFTVAFKKYFGRTPFEVKYGAKGGSKIVQREKLVAEVKQYVDDHIDENPTFTKLAPIFSIAKEDLKIAFINHTGESPSDYIASKQIERAKSYLLSGKSVYEVTGIMKYKNISAFSQYFKKATGQSPSQYYKNMIGNNILTQHYRRLTNMDIQEVEAFIRGNLGDKNIENTIRDKLQLPIYLIEAGFKQFRNRGLSETIIHERLNVAVKMLNDRISISIIKDVVGFGSEKDLVLALLNEQKMSANMLSKKMDLKKYILSEQIFRDLLKRYCFDHINTSTSEEALSYFLNIPIQEFKILRKVYLGSTLSQYFVGLKMDKAKELLREGVLVESISIKLGYALSRDLSTAFKRNVGMTIRAYQKLLNLHPNRSKSVDKNGLLKAEEMVKKNFASQNLLNLFQKTYPKNYRTILSKFKADYGKTPLEFATELRMEKAKELLSNGMAVGEVAKIVGYTQLSNFSNSFKKHFGTTAFSIKPQKNVGRVPKAPRELVKQFKLYVNQHIDESLSYSRIAEYLGVAKENLKEIYQTVCRSNIEAYIEESRIDRAKSLLKQGYKIIDVARIMHYSDGTTFAAFFKRGAGMTASEYLARLS